MTAASTWSRADSTLPALLRALIAAEVESSAGPIEVSAEVVRELFMISAAERLGGLILSAVERGVLELTPDLVALHEESRRADVASELKRSMVLHDVVGRLDGAGLDYRLMKGLAAGHTIYAHPSHRTTGDIDLLIAPGSIDEAAWMLLDAGYTIAHPFRGRAHASISRSLTVRHDVGVEVDLHRRFGDASHWAMIETGSPFRVAPIEVVVDGRPMKALPLEDQLVASLAHLTRPHHLVTMVDLALLVARLDDVGVDWAAIAARVPGAVNMRASAVVAPYLELPAAFTAHRSGAPRVESWLVRMTLGRPDVEAVEQVRLASSLATGASYLVEIVRPSAEWRRFSSLVTERESSGSVDRILSRVPFRRRADRSSP